MSPGRENPQVLAAAHLPLGHDGHAGTHGCPSRIPALSRRGQSKEALPPRSCRSAAAGSRGCPHLPAWPAAQRRWAAVGGGGQAGDSGQAGTGAVAGLSIRPPALFTRPPALFTRPPALFTRPPALFTRPPALFTRPPALFTRPSTRNQEVTGIRPAGRVKRAPDPVKGGPALIEAHTRPRKRTPGPMKRVSGPMKRTPHPMTRTADPMRRARTRNA